MPRKKQRFQESLQIKGPRALGQGLADFAYSWGNDYSTFNPLKSADYVGFSWSGGGTAACTMVRGAVKELRAMAKDRFAEAEVKREAPALARRAEKIVKDRCYR